ncbi:MAG: Gfo/Idh/MocA family oxidoreductase [Fuerstiella sp.]|jgi:UDP-N-acetylglucosamine 3-dehydrogenase|nr:Gfo/Idh/MocA family oxidoreductase [Fuerstiella sp.]MCP4511886.1 Gfo/Idh/MocA family oxidoreductase [Fuerstiella sp.]MDG2127628.1 Gfo/Idh/MocA family oxidoreductase [Fuerstiella sp.]
MKTIRWGIIGLGRFGTIHAETLRSLPGSELVAVCNHDERRLQQASLRFPGAAAVREYDDVVNSKDVDVVSVTTHWQQHQTVAEAALQSGKHVFLEKPMAATGEQCRRLLEVAADSPGYLMVGHICRFDPRVTLAQQAIADGRIGRIVSMHAKRNLPKAPGNIRLDKISPLMGDGIHDADLMMWFMGCAPSRIYARNVRANNFTYPDLGWAMLEFDDAAVGVIETNWCLPETVPTAIDATLEVIGTDGKLTVDCSQTGFTLVDASGPKMSDTVYWPQQHGRRVGALATELAYFADCVRLSTVPTVITPPEAARAVMVMEAAEESASTRQPVELSQVADLV